MDPGSWTPGGETYLSGTSGEITQIEPVTGYVKPLGYAVSATEIFFHPENGWSAGESMINRISIINSMIF